MAGVELVGTMIVAGTAVVAAAIFVPPLLSKGMPGAGFLFVHYWLQCFSFGSIFLLPDNRTNIFHQEYLISVFLMETLPFCLAKSPTVSEIRATPARPNVDETICLEASISDFAPKDIKVAWYKDWMKLQEDNTLNPQIARNGLCFYVSKLQFSPKASDNKTSLRCEVIHLATHCFIEKFFELKLRGKSSSLRANLSAKSTLLPEPTDFHYTMHRKLPATGLNKNELLQKYIWFLAKILLSY